MNFFKRFFAPNQSRKHKEVLANLKDSRHLWDDVLTAEGREACDRAIQECSEHPDGSCDSAAESVFKRFSPVKHQVLFSWLDTIVAVGTVAFGIRALGFQPFRIPTGSMQPTLYGIHYMAADNASTPHLDKLSNFTAQWIFGADRAKAVVRESGFIDAESVQVEKSWWQDKTHFQIGSQVYTLPGEPRRVAEYADLSEKLYQAGEVLGGGALVSGDSLLVERFSLYWRGPKRGDIMVFSTGGLSYNGMELGKLSGAFYVKRLAGMPGDTLKIENNLLLVKERNAEKFVPIYELAPIFKKVCSGKGGYQGHLNGVGESLLLPGTTFTVPDDHYFMLGDNSRFSLDSRFWGCVPRRNLLGRPWFVFWPFSRRWGIPDRREALDIPTGEAGMSTYPVMSKQ